MTKITNTGGILQPLMAYRFRVVFSDEETSLLSQQIMNCSFNFVEHEVRIQLRQTITKGMISMIDSLCKGYSSIMVDTLDEKSNHLFSMRLTHCNLIDHSFKLDYSDSDVAIHNLVFKYALLQEMDPVE